LFLLGSYETTGENGKSGQHRARDAAEDNDRGTDTGPDSRVLDLKADGARGQRSAGEEPDPAAGDPSNGGLKPADY
jgi:hypothetical protein